MFEVKSNFGVVLGVLSFRVCLIISDNCGVRCSNFSNGIGKLLLECFDLFVKLIFAALLISSSVVSVVAFLAISEVEFFE